jgi:hypothetical protein
LLLKRRRAVATPGSGVGCEGACAFVPRLLLEGPRATPRRAVVLCAERASRLKSGVLAVAPI